MDGYSNRETTVISANEEDPSSFFALERSTQSGDYDPKRQTRVHQILDRLDTIAGSSASLVRSPVEISGGTNSERAGLMLPRYLFLGPRGGGDPVRIAVFAGIHGDEPAGSHAIVRFAEELERHSELSRGYQLFLYPICNPSGFAKNTRCSGSGKDLNREFWKGSREPEVVLLEREIRTQRFQGLISLHADDTSSGVYGFVRGAVLTRALLEPALSAAEEFLPRNRNGLIDGFAAFDGIISECYDGILTSPPELNPTPFEIILETPHDAPADEQVNALVAAMRAILEEYQKLLSFAANL